jgi:hypothetical protein
MFEHLVERAFQQMADQEQPQSRVSIQQALRNGRTRLRRRRLVRAVGTPVLAAAAVMAVALPVSMSAGSHDATHRRAAVVPASVVPVSPATSRSFSPLALYASFGWLPASAASNLFGTMQATSEQLFERGWVLQTYAVGRCKRLGDQMECGWGKDKGNDSCLANAYIQARAPAIHGRPAYWAYDLGTRNSPGQRCLTWEYQPGGWAHLMGSAAVNPSKRLMVRVASAVRFGGHQPSIKFAAQLRKLPGRWQVVPITDFYLDYGALLATGTTITNGETTLGVGLNFSSPSHNKCLDAKSACRVINGYYVTLVSPSVIPGFSIVAPDADKAYVTIGAAAGHGPQPHKNVGLMYTVFSHMKMLGPNPADWTTEPIR